MAMVRDFLHYMGGYGTLLTKPHLKPRIVENCLDFRVNEMGLSP
jgi:hypothetical protein